LELCWVSFGAQYPLLLDVESRELKMDGEDLIPPLESFIPRFLFLLFFLVGFEFFSFLSRLMYTSFHEVSMPVSAQLVS
jgi:hypothetical protein